MSYTKDAQGNIIQKKWWQKDKPVDLPPPLPPKDDLAGLEPTQEQLFEAVISNQKVMFELLKSIESDIKVIKDDSVDEATERFKALQKEILEQVEELEKKKGKKK